MIFRMFRMSEIYMIFRLYGITGISRISSIFASSLSLNIESQNMINVQEFGITSESATGKGKYLIWQLSIY